MKKNIIIAVVLIAVVAGGGYFAWTKMQARPAVEKLKEGPGKGLTVLPPDDTIIGWLSRGSAQCSVTDSAGKTMRIMAKKQTVRVEGVPYALGADGQTADAIMIANPEWTFIWSGTQGTKMNHKLLREGMTSAQKAEKQDYSWEDTVASWEASGYQYTCDETGLSDDLFVPPAEVQFNDLTETLKQLQQVSEQMPTATMNQEDIEAALENLDLEAIGTGATADNAGSAVTGASEDASEEISE